MPHRHICPQDIEEASILAHHLGQHFPGLARLRRYEAAWLRVDVLAGITVAAYLVPQVMAYATVAGLPPVVGLWAALRALVLYAVGLIAAAVDGA